MWYHHGRQRICRGPVPEGQGDQAWEMMAEKEIRKIDGCYAPFSYLAMGPNACLGWPVYLRDRFLSRRKGTTSQFRGKGRGRSAITAGPCDQERLAQEGRTWQIVSAQDLLAADREHGVIADAWRRQGLH